MSKSIVSSSCSSSICAPGRIHGANSSWSLGWLVSVWGAEQGNASHFGVVVVAAAAATDTPTGADQHLLPSGATMDRTALHPEGLRWAALPSTLSPRWVYAGPHRLQHRVPAGSTLGRTWSSASALGSSGISGGSNVLKKLSQGTCSVTNALAPFSPFLPLTRFFTWVAEPGCHVGVDTRSLGNTGSGRVEKRAEGEEPLVHAGHGHVTLRAPPRAHLLHGHVLALLPVDLATDELLRHDLVLRLQHVRLCQLLASEERVLAEAKRELEAAVLAGQHLHARGVK
eukprot:170242-Chlamydomonas_euryale.AAC.9